MSTTERSRLAMRRYLARGSWFVLESLLLSNEITASPEQCFAIATALAPRLDELVASAPVGTRGDQLLDAAIDAAIDCAAKTLDLEPIDAPATLLH